MSDNPPNPLDSLLSEFALGPSWARAKSEPSNQKYTHESPEREHPQRRRDDRGDSRGRREGGDRRGQRDDRGENRGRRDGGNRRDFQRGRGPDTRREEFIPPAEGVTVSVVPEKTAIQLVCKEIHQVARVYPLFDIAQIILAERSRCRAIFEISEKHEPFYRCKIDEAIFLTKEEAMRHLLESPWKNRFVAETTVETDPPKGNFQSVARCGISGQLLGPPNYHGYQTEIRRMHREFFPEMRFESYLAKVRTDRSEDAVNAWLESMKNQTRWRILSDEESAIVTADSIRQAEEPKPEPAPESPAPASEEAPSMPEEEAEAPAETPAEEPVVAEEAPAAEEPAAEEQASEEPPAPEPTEEPEAPAAPEHKWFTDRAEFERALAAEVLGKVYHLTRKAKVSAAIPGRNLSPGLLVRLKATGSHHRKHPAIIIPDICKILESEHMPVFKRKGKLYTGPARPHALALDAVLAERPGQMVKWIRENPPAKLEGLWQAMLPEGSTAPPQGYAADLFWLLQQGHILLYTDDTLVVQDPPKPQEPKKPKQPKKKATVAADSTRPAETTTASEEKTTESLEAPGTTQDSLEALGTTQDSATPPADSKAAPEEQSVSKEPSPETIKEASETTAASSGITGAAPKEAPHTNTEPAPETIEPDTKASAEVTEAITESEKSPAEIVTAPEPTEVSNEPTEPSPEAPEPEEAGESDEAPGKDPLH